MLKKIIISIIFLFFLVKPVLGKEGTTLIINQIRGNEACCQPGSLDLVKKLKNQFNLQELPIAWALRFDVLTNDNFLEELKDVGELGILLEVTPQLANASGVIYKGREDGNNWYFAKNAFLVGYSINDRKKIIDTLFGEFKKKLGYYPSFTVSWMIDSWSLNYLNNTYGVKLHELTREQYEIDSYTLDGGIFNYPYYPSKDHPLIPGNSQNKLNLLIVRQTISDLIRNYGSSKSYYTSQPNDYLESKENLDFFYFKSLLDNTLNQPLENNFALIGFENSFSWEKYGQEFLKQLELIVQYQKEGKIKVKKPSVYFSEFAKRTDENRAFYLKDNFIYHSPMGVLWYFGKDYRARVIIKDKQVILDDLRSFVSFTDPYSQNPVNFDFAYWIIPYLFNGSQQYSLSQDQEKLIKRKNLSYGSTLSDLYSNPFGIVLGEGEFNLVEREEIIEIDFKNPKNGSVKFTPIKIIIDESLDPHFNFQEYNKLNDLFLKNENQVFKFNKHFDFLIKKTGNNLNLGWQTHKEFVPLFKLIKDDNNFILEPEKQVNNLNLLTPIFQPDKTYLPIDINKSIFYWNNKKAIINRNPIRLFILPLNSLSRPTKISKVEIKSSDKDNLEITIPSDYLYKISPWFIDINSSRPIRTMISLSIDGKEVIKNEEIEFIIDCKKNLRFCLTSTPQIIKYIGAILEEQKTRIKEGLKNLWQM